MAPRVASQMRKIIAIIVGLMTSGLGIAALSAGSQAAQAAPWN